MKRRTIIFLIFMVVTVLFAGKVSDQIEKKSRVEEKVYNWESGSTEFVTESWRESRSVPNLIDYQGKITDSGSNPITSSVSIIFTIYDASSGGSNLWDETHASVTPVDGLVHVLLGSQSSFENDLFDGSDLWLGINVNDDGEMTPRLRIVSVPYAIYAQTAETDNDWTISGVDLYTENTGSVGIGTITPNTNTKLHVNNGTILFDGTTGSTPVSGEGTRFMWIPSKSAIRAGYINGTQWDDANIGLYSAAFGYNNTASSPYSFATGTGNTISGGSSAAFGLSNTVTRPYSYAFGNNSSATGSYSFAFGRYSEAQALHSIVLGRFNVVSGTWGTWIDSEPLFILGNGADDLNRSNALTVFKDGRTTIGSDTRGEMLTVEGTIESTSGGIKFPDGTTQTTAAGGGATEIDDLTDGKTGGNSVFLGSGAGINDDGINSFNVGIGVNALNTNISGWCNTAIGHGALENCTSGTNCAFGKSALSYNTTGQSNVGIGIEANYYNQEGSNNTIIGYGAGKGIYAHNKTGNIFIGYEAGANQYGDNILNIENSSSGTPLIYGEFDNDKIVINGEFQATGITRDSSGDAGTSGQVLSSTTTGTNWIDAASGDGHSLDAADGSPTDAVYVDNDGRVGINDNTPSYQLDVDGSMNISSSKIYLNNFLSIYQRFTSICIGIEAGSNYLVSGTGLYNSFLGGGAGHNITNGSHNTFVGYLSGTGITGGSENTLVGDNSGMNLTTGDKNILIGVQSGAGISTTDNNTIIGYDAGHYNNGSGNVFIGYQAGYNTSGVSNKLFIENSTSGLPLIFGDFSDGSEVVKVFGDFETSGTTTLNDVLHLTPMASAPASGSNGDIYVGTDNHIYCYLNGSWKQLDN